MDVNKLDQRLIQLWTTAAADLGVDVTAPVELRDDNGQFFQCEAFVLNFGSKDGAYVVSAANERHIRNSLRVTRGIWVSVASGHLQKYERKHFINELLDWGWFGPKGAEPAWYAERMPSSR